MRLAQQIFSQYDFDTATLRSVCASHSGPAITLGSFMRQVAQQRGQVLLVDRDTRGFDRLNECEVLKLVLQCLGYKTQVVLDLQSAAELMQKDTFDFLVLDPAKYTEVFADPLAAFRSLCQNQTTFRVIAHTQSEFWLSKALAHGLAGWKKNCALSDMIDNIYYDMVEVQRRDKQKLMKDIRSGAVQWNSLVSGPGPDQGVEL